MKKRGNHHGNTNTGDNYFGLTRQSLTLRRIFFCILLLSTSTTIFVLQRQPKTSYYKLMHFPFLRLSKELHNSTSSSNSSGSILKGRIGTSVTCSPIQKIIFLKTFKTAGTTTASIFERYGYSRNLSFVIGKHNLMSFETPFSRNIVLPFPNMLHREFDILSNHARYNRKEMDLTIPNAKYVTILRKPEDQLESAFGYFEMYKRINTAIGRNPLETFMNHPKYYLPNLRKRQLARNGQLFALGFDHKFDENDTKIRETINRLGNELDLVLISEYYDESLILLRKLLCWDYKDILYVPAGIRSASHRFNKSQKLVRKLKLWNHGDVLLYNHFNRTFWKRVAAYGIHFQSDLERFRRLNQKAFDQCIDINQIDQTDKREDKFVLKNKSETCVGILRADIEYTDLIRKVMIEKYG